MNQSRLQFFVTCPSCKSKFGVNPEVVLKYLDRVLGEYAREFERVEKRLRESKEEAGKSEK